MKIVSAAVKASVVKKTKNLASNIVIYGLLILLTYIILFPFIIKIFGSFMSWNDHLDRTVILIPRYPTLYNYIAIIEESGYLKSLGGSFLLSGISAVAQTFVCAMVGYAMAKLRGKLIGIVMFLVVLTIVVPPQVVLVPLFLKFRFFDIFGLFQLITGRPINLLDSLAPMTILSLTGFGLKNGLFIFVMRQFFKGVPEELEEAALIDGYGIFRSYLRIILPISIPILITVFILAFSWQWTDTFYSNIFFSNFPVLARTTFIMPPSTGAQMFQMNTILHTGVLMAVLPLVIIFIILQKWVVTGIERSGIVG